MFTFTRLHYRNSTQMRIGLLFAIFIFASLSSSAQLKPYWEIGASTYINNNWQINNNIIDAGNQQAPGFTIDYNFGMAGTYYWNPRRAVSLGLNFGQFTQEYRGLYEVSGFPFTYDSKITLDVVNIPVSVRFGMNDFFEVGTQVTMINGGDFHFEGPDPVVGLNPLNPIDPEATTELVIDKDVSDAYKSMQVSAFVGFGSIIPLYKGLGVLTTIRAHYGLLDIEGVDGFGDSLNDKDNPLLYNNDPELGRYASYEPTRSIGLSFKAGLVWKFISNSPKDKS